MEAGHPRGPLLHVIGPGLVGRSFPKPPPADQVVDLPALMRRQSPVDDHPPAPLASTPPDPLRRPPPARPGEPRLAPATRRLQENGDPAQAARDGSPLLL